MAHPQKSCFSRFGEGSRKFRLSKCFWWFQCRWHRGCTWRNLRGPHYQPTSVYVRPQSPVNQQYESACPLWIPDKGVADKVGCDSHGFTPHHIMCCQSPLLLLPPTPKFPFVTSPCHHQLSLHLLPLTLQGRVRSTVEHWRRKHILEDGLEGVLIMNSPFHVWDQRNNDFWIWLLNMLCKPV